MLNFLNKKHFQELEDNEVLLLAISNFEEDIKLYDEYSSHFLWNIQKHPDCLNGCLY